MAFQHVYFVADACFALYSEEREVFCNPVPIEAAHDVARMLTEGGVRALWNFTPTRILVPEGVVVANTSIYSHLAVMYNRLSSLNL